MKSTIKVDYKSRMGSFGDKEPVIRVNVVESDDPRDTLLNEIFVDDPNCRRTGICNVYDPSANGDTFMVYRRNDREHYDGILFPIFSALCKYSGINAGLTTQNDEQYFELISDSNVRSKPIGLYPSGTDIDTAIDNGPSKFSDLEIELKYIQNIVDVWKDFEYKVATTEK